MTAKFKRFFSHKNEINYLYFSCFLLFLTFLSVSHFFSIDKPLSGIPLFFLMYGIGQAFFEVCLFVLVVAILQKWAPRWVSLSFISASFLFLLLHFTNFTMVRLMDSSLIYIFKFFFCSGVGHLLAGFQALNLNWTMIFLTGGAFIAIPIAGILFYRLTFYLAHRKPFELSFGQILSALSSAALLLFVLDLLAHPYLTQRVYIKYQKTLPLGTTFLAPRIHHVSLPSAFLSCRAEKEIRYQLPYALLAHRPNIYLFIIETFRKDFVESVAENLNRFGKENIQIVDSSANASSTHLSWFSIFHSDLTFHWTSMRDTWKKGSVPLQILKNLGYKIHVYSSADLRYFNMDELIFGHKRALIDHVEEYTFDRSIEPCDRDALALKSFKRDLTDQGNVYLFFFDSTHSEYSFPKDFPLKYEPISKEIDYLTIGPKSPELEGIKNRYRNSICYVDFLMGQFFDHLKERDLYDDAIVAITGDHGEEFFEHGALFHGTHLNDCQTRVPILFKFPSNDWIPQTETASHMDLFPTILHYLTKQSDFSSIFDGKSIFGLDRPPFRITVLQNGPDTPVEFMIEKEGLKVQARYRDPSKLEIIELQGLLEPDIFSPLLKKI